MSTSTLWRDSEGGQNFLEFVAKRKCGLCKRQFDNPWVVPTGRPYPHNVEPNAEIAFHWEDTHGFPHDLFFELVMGLMFKPRETLTEMSKLVNSRGTELTKPGKQE